MHFRTLLPVLLATSATALPGRKYVREEPTPSGLPPEPTEVLDDPSEICALEWNEGDATIARDTWIKSGARDFLYDFIEKNGGTDWSSNMFEATVAGGSQGGSTYDCTNFPAESSCNSPGHQLCMEYDPPAMFFVHIAISNLYSSFIKLHEALQDSMIEDLATDIKEIVELYGPPPEEEDGMFSILSGSLVGAAAFAGPFWQIASPMTGLAAITSIASGVASSENEPEPIDFEHDLEESLGNFYREFSETLEDTVNAAFGGDFSGFEEMDEDPIDFITNLFADGKMLDFKLVKPAVDDWIDAARNMIDQGLVIQAMKENEYYIWQNWYQDDEECEYSAHSIDDICTCIGFNGEGPFSVPNCISAYQYDSFVDYYGFDYEEAIGIGIECNNTGDADFSVIPPFDEEPSLPDCFVNLPVRLMDYTYLPPDEDDIEDGEYVDPPPSGW